MTPDDEITILKGDKITLQEERMRLTNKVFKLEEWLRIYRVLRSAHKSHRRQLEAENERLKEELNQVTNGRWTQTEIDAGKWRGQQMFDALKEDG